MSTLPKRKFFGASIVFRIVLILLVVGHTSLTSAADDRHLRILYPVLAEPYASIFEDIMRGVQETSKLPVNRVPLPPNPNIDALKHSIPSHDRVIALGGRSIQIAKLLALPEPPIVGAVILNPAKYNDSTIGVSLTPDPQLLLKKLRLFAPKVKKVLVVYQPGTHNYLIELATNAAKQLGLKLDTLPAADLQEAASQYKTLFSTGISDNAALWLMRDNSLLDEKALVPYILEQAWRDDVIVFSSNPNHVSRGALFSLFPDNQGLGHQLGNLVNDLVDEIPPVAAIQPLRAVRTAVNIRTAEHLGLDIDFSNNNEVQLTFPAR